MQRKKFRSAILLSIAALCGCSGDSFTMASDTESCPPPGDGGSGGGEICAGAAGASGSGGSSAGNGQAGTAGKTAGAGQAGSSGKGGASGKAGASGAGGKCCTAGAAGASGSSAGAGQAGAAGNAAGASGGGQAGSAGSVAGQGGIGGTTSGAAGIGGAGQAGAAGNPGGSSGASGEAGSAGAPAVCGNALIEAGEQCEGTNFNGQTCASIKGPGYTGDLACLGCLIESAPCLPPGPACGNGTLDPGEVCEGTNFNGATCASIKGPGWGGSLTCSLCTTIDSSTCIASPPNCDPGTFGTPTSVTAKANGSFTNALYVHFVEGQDMFANNLPYMANFVGKFPGEVVFSGNNSGEMMLVGGDNQTFYLVNVSAVPGSTCAGFSQYTITCDEKVAKDFRCTYYPAGETSCNVHATFTDIGAGMSFNITTSGDNKVLASIPCIVPLQPQLSLPKSYLPRIRDTVLPAYPPSACASILQHRPTDSEPCPAQSTIIMI